MLLCCLTLADGALMLKSCYVCIILNNVPFYNVSLSCWHKFDFLVCLFHHGALSLTIFDEEAQLTNIIWVLATAGVTRQCSLPTHWQHTYISSHLLKSSCWGIEVYLTSFAKIWLQLMLLTRSKGFIKKSRCNSHISTFYSLSFINKWSRSWDLLHHYKIV